MIELIVSLLSPILALQIVKLFIIAFLAIYIIFAFVLLRQAEVMLKTVEAQISPVIYVIAIVHLLSPILILLFVILAV